METIEAIREMNSKHPPGRRSTSINDLCARVEALEKENKMLRDASEQPRQSPPAPNPGPSAQTATLDAPDAAEARSKGLGAIRHGVQEGRLSDDDYWRSTVLALCDRVEGLEKAARPLAEYAAAHYQQAAIAEQVGYSLPTDDNYPIEVPLGLLVSLRRILLS